MVNIPVLVCGPVLENHSAGAGELAGVTIAYALNTLVNGGGKS